MIVTEKIEVGQDEVLVTLYENGKGQMLPPRGPRRLISFVQSFSAIKKQKLFHRNLR